MVTVKNIQVQLTKNLVIPIILDLLDNHRLCGYEIMLTIRKTYGVNLSASTMYSTLGNMECRNLIASELEPGNRRLKKIYKLTREGQNVLNYSINTLNLICKALDNENNKTNKNLQIGILIE